MIKYLLIIVLVIVNIILFCKINERKELYGNSQGSCDPEDADISGDTVIKCVEKCSKSRHCSEDAEGNNIDIIPLAQDYLNKYPNVHVDVPRPNDPEILELSNSDCLEKCLKCGWTNEGGDCKCSWSAKCQQDAASKYDDYKKKWDSKGFMIGAIPEDKKITITWDENLTEDEVESYIIYIFQKNNVGQVLTQKITHSDIIKNQNNSIYIVDQLLNNVHYGIQINKISKSFPGHTKLVKTSNTIYAVPSEINLLNFGNLDNTQKEYDSLAENLLDNFVGREFEINLG
jgi:hypothetical protein